MTPTWRKNPKKNELKWQLCQNQKKSLLFLFICSPQLQCDTIFRSEFDVSLNFQSEIGSHGARQSGQFTHRNCRNSISRSQKINCIQFFYPGNGYELFSSLSLALYLHAVAKYCSRWQIANCHFCCDSSWLCATSDQHTYQLALTHFVWMTRIPVVCMQILE